MKKAWIAYVLMTTASSRAIATRMGNSRQNDRFRRRRVAGFGPPEPAFPSAGAVSSPAGPSPADPSAGAASSPAGPSAAGPLASAVVAASAALGPASDRPGSGASARWSALTGRFRSGPGDTALSPWPASDSAPGVTPRPAPLIRAPSVRAHRVPGTRARARQAATHGHRDLDGSQPHAPRRGSPSSSRA